MAPFFKHATIRVFLAVILFDGVHSAPRPNLDRRTSLSSVSTSTSTTRSTTSSTTSSTASSMATVTAPSPSTPSKFPPCAILSKPVLDSTVDCHTFLSDQSISIHRHRFIRLNPNLTSACNLTTNERYCLKPQPDVLPTLQGIPDNPIAVPSDTIKDCTFFDQASDRSQILLRHNLTDFGFLLMNPSALDEFNPNTQYCAIPMGNSTVVDQSFTDETNDNEPTVHGISLVPRPSTSASASSAASSDTDGNGASSTSSLSTSASASVSVSSITESNGVSISAISLPPPTGSTTASGSSSVAASNTDGNSVSSTPPSSTTVSGSSAVSSNAGGNTVTASQPDLLSVNGISDVPLSSIPASEAPVTSSTSSAA